MQVTKKENETIEDHIMVTVLPEVLIAGEDRTITATKEKRHHYNGFYNTLVGPDMNQTMSIACIDLIAVFIIE